jgi:hypothetical protein
MSSREYQAWNNMKGRCLNPKRADYARYGGRGITVCLEWRDSFSAFLRDVGPRPSAKHQLDRINNAGSYEAGNVHWVTHVENANNKRNNRFLAHNGRRMTIAEWERFMGVNDGTFKRRVLLGWSDHDVLTKPLRSMPTYTFGDETLSMAEWSRRTGIKISTLFKRLKNGWPIERILSAPVDVKRRNSRGR